MSEDKRPMYRGRPIGGSRSSPKADSEAAPPDGERIKAALRKLQDLHRKGEISDEEYRAKRKILLEAM